MSSATETAPTISDFTLDPDTGAIWMTWTPDIRYHLLERESHQTRVIGLGTASAHKAMRLDPIPLTKHSTEFAPSNHPLEEERFLPASKGYLLPYVHLSLPGKNSTPPSTSVPIITPSVTHSVTRPNEATPNIPNSSTLLTWSEGLSPTTSVPTSMYSGFLPVSNEVSPKFQGDHLPHPPQYMPTVRSPSTERSVSLSPTASTSPLASSCSSSSCRHPVQVEPKVILSNPMLHALVLQIFSEPWFVNGQTERNLTDEEASSGLGFAGKSVLLAFSTRLRDGVARGGKWRCLICDTLPVALSNGKGYTSTREDRILKHIRHHFGHRPWACGGQCGMREW